MFKLVVLSFGNNIFQHAYTCTIYILCSKQDNLPQLLIKSLYLSEQYIQANPKVRRDEITDELGSTGFGSLARGVCKKR